MISSLIWLLLIKLGVIDPITRTVGDIHTCVDC